MTNESPIAEIGPVGPRFTLMVTHVGIDDRELGALNDRIGSGSASRVGEPNPVPSCISARPRRLAAFSSSRFTS